VDLEKAESTRIKRIFGFRIILPILVDVGFFLWLRQQAARAQVMFLPVFFAHVVFPNTSTRAGTVDEQTAVHIDAHVGRSFLFDFEEHQIAGAQPVPVDLLANPVLIIGLPGKVQAVLPEDPLSIARTIKAGSGGASAGMVTESQLAAGGLNECIRVDGPWGRRLVLLARTAPALQRCERHQP